MGVCASLFLVRSCGAQDTCNMQCGSSPFPLLTWNLIMSPTCLCIISVCSLPTRRIWVRSYWTSRSRTKRLCEGEAAEWGNCRNDDLDHDYIHVCNSRKVGNQVIIKWESLEVFLMGCMVVCWLPQFKNLPIVRVVVMGCVGYMHGVTTQLCRDTWVLFRQGRFRWKTKLFLRTSVKMRWFFFGSKRSCISIIHWCQTIVGDSSLC